MPHRLNTRAPDLPGENRTEPVPPEPDRLMHVSILRSCSRSSTFRNDSGNRTYIMTASRMISGLILEYRKMRARDGLSGAGIRAFVQRAGQCGCVDEIPASRLQAGGDWADGSAAPHGSSGFGLAPCHRHEALAAPNALRSSTIAIISNRCG